MSFFDQMQEMNYMQVTMKIGKTKFLFETNENTIDEYKYGFDLCSGCEENLCGYGIDGFDISMQVYGWSQWNGVCKRCVNTSVKYNLKHLAQLRKHLGKE
jgi:hypothetical protein